MKQFVNDTLDAIALAFWVPSPVSSPYATVHMSNLTNGSWPFNASAEWKQTDYVVIEFDACVGNAFAQVN